MKLWTILLISSIAGVSGCATQEIRIPEWDLPEQSTNDITHPAELPELCDLVHDGHVFTLTRECAQRLLAYEEVAEANTIVARENANGLASSQEAYNALIRAGQAQREVVMIRQEMLEQERREHMVDNLTHRLVIALAAIAAISTN